jgi:translation initiation factor 2 subunit 2
MPLTLLAMQEQPFPERKQRKSVAFSDGNTLIDENGEMTTTHDTGDDKTTAESHTSGARRPISS